MDGTGGIRADLVARIRRQIADKTYEVKSQEIADKIAQKLGEDEKIILPYRKTRWTA